MHDGSWTSLGAVIRQTLKDHGWKRLLLAVSGGLDSICLAHYFVAYKDALGIEGLGIAHVNHGLRDGTADRDAKFVENFASAQGVPFFLRELDGKALKNKEGSLEENAREARYVALLDIAIENNMQAIVTAHHAGDQAETMYLRLRRGVTLAGLHGIQQVRDFKTSDEQNVVQLYRPFLSITREELREYAIANNISWCEDESNADKKFARNQVRHEALPELERRCPGTNKQLCHIAQIAGRAHCKIIRSADTLFSQATIPPTEWPFEASLSPYANVLAISENKLQQVFSDFSKATRTTPHSDSTAIPPRTNGLCEIFRLWLDSRGFRFPMDFFQSDFASKSSTNEPQAPFSASSFHYRTRFIEKCRHIIWIYDSCKNRAPSNLYFSNEKQRFSGIPGLWRHPQDGDVLSPMDMKIKARKLATWLQEKSIPHWIRQFLQIYAQDSRVLFVSGIRNRKFDK